LRREGEVFEESEGPIEDILGEGKDKIHIFSISDLCFPLVIYFIYLFIPKGSPPRSNRMEGGQGRQFDSSCDRPALPYSFFAPGGALTLPPMPHHSRNSSTITSISISVHITNQHTHFPSLPSFGFILRLLVTQRTVFTHPTLPHSRHPPPSPGTLSKHTPRGLCPSRISLSASGHFFPDRPVPSLQSSSLGLHREHARLSAFNSNEPYCLR
jgi:hypothetical protein